MIWALTAVGRGRLAIRPVFGASQSNRFDTASQACFQPHSPLTWVFAYQLPLAFDPPEELIKMQSTTTFDQPKESVKAH